jgi:predicted alpha/beta-fold hydrolase
MLNGHLQTFYAALTPDSELVKYKRELLTMADGGHVSLDWPMNNNVECKNLIFILHGLTGGSGEV